MSETMMQTPLSQRHKSHTHILAPSHVLSQFRAKIKNATLLLSLGSLLLLLLLQGVALGLAYGGGLGQGRVWVVGIVLIAGGAGCGVGGWWLWAGVVFPSAGPNSLNPAARIAAKFVNGAFIDDDHRQ